MAKEKEKEAPNLDKIVADLHPDKVNEKVGKAHYKARGTYELKKTEVDDFDTFREEIISYVKHHHKKVFGTEMPDDMAYAKALQILEGTDRKMKGAYNAARQGRLAEVLDDIANGLRTEQEQAYVLNVMHKIDPFDYETHVKVAEKYIAMAQKISPETKYAKPEAIAHDYQQLLAAHRQLMATAAEPAKAYEPKKEKDKKAA